MYKSVFRGQEISVALTNSCRPSELDQGLASLLREFDKGAHHISSDKKNPMEHSERNMSFNESSHKTRCTNLKIYLILNELFLPSTAVSVKTLGLTNKGFCD